MLMDRNNFAWLWATGLLRGGRSEGESGWDAIDGEKPGLLIRFLQLVALLFVIGAGGLVLTLVIAFIRLVIISL